MIADRRATSTALGYALALGISAILISGLLIAGGGLMESQRDQSARTELRVVGQTLADDLSSAARLADCPSCELTLRTDLPDRVAGQAYQIRVNETPETNVYRLVLTATASDTTTDVRLRTRVPVEETTVVGGSLVIEYDPAASRLEVRHD